MGDRVVSRGRDSQGPATWGQRYIWNEMRVHFPLDGKQNQLTGIELDRGWDNSVARVCAVVSDLVSRHEIFRTTYELRPGDQLWQTVTGRAEFPLEIETVASRPTWDEVRDAMQRSRLRRFELSTDLSARVTLFVLDGRVAWLVLTMPHMAVDVLSVRQVDAELRQALAGGEVPQPALQPLDWVEWERSDLGRAQNARAVQYWKDTLEQFLPLPGDGARIGCSPRYRRAEARLPRLFRAAGAVANQVGATRSSALIAALTWTLSRSIGADSLPMSIRTGNRTPRSLREAVGHYAEMVPVIIEGPTAIDLPEYVRKVHWKLMHCYRYGHYDPVDVAGPLQRLGNRLGHRRPLRIVMNYWPVGLVDAEPAGPSGPEPAGQLSWAEGGVDEEFVGLLLNIAPHRSSISLLLDTTLLEPGELEEWLLDTEDLLHRAAMALSG